jgi:hypothetical protein
MREIVLGNKFEYGFDQHNNCPSNREKQEEGVPLYKEVSGYSTRRLEENKSLVEKQNFNIATGIPGGKEAEHEVWINPFDRSFKKANFSQSGSQRSFGQQENEGDRMRRSSVPFGMNSPVTLKPLDASRYLKPAFSPNYQQINSYFKIKGACERSRVPFSPDERIVSKLNPGPNSSYRAAFSWKQPKYYLSS